MTSPETETWRVPTRVAPDLSTLPEELRTRIAFDDGARELVVRGRLTGEELRRLRDCEPSSPWQVVVDQLARAARADDGDGHFPSTMWGLLSQLDAGEEAHWREFIERYQGPIERTIRRQLGRLGMPRDQAEALGPAFFGWFFEKEIYNKLKRTDDDGRVLRFRGYLACCIRTYLRETLKRRERSLDPEAARWLEAPPAGDDLDQALASEFCTELVTTELTELRKRQVSLWRALMRDVHGLTLQEVAERLLEESAGDTGSIAQAHRQRHKARRVFRQRLIDYRLAQATLDAEEALAEFRDLAPALAEALRAYAAEHPVEA